MPPGMKRLKQPEEENGRLKRVVAEPSRDQEKLQDGIKRKLHGLFANGSQLNGIRQQMIRRIFSGRYCNNVDVMRQRRIFAALVSRAFVHT